MPPRCGWVSFHMQCFFQVIRILPFRPSFCAGLLFVFSCLIMCVVERIDVVHVKCVQSGTEAVEDENQNMIHSASAPGPPKHLAQLKGPRQPAILTAPDLWPRKSAVELKSPAQSFSRMSRAERLFM